MLDDLQDFDDSLTFLDELDELDLDDLEDNLKPIKVPSGGLIFGMNPRQRFVLALEMFVLACVLSSLCLLVFNKISPPF